MWNAVANSVCRKYAFFILTCILGLLASSRALAQTYVFGTAAYPAPGVPSTSPPQADAPVVTADFNNDGIPDVAILGQFSTGVQVLSIFMGKPDGTFASRVDYAVQGTSLAVDDFNGDGKLDIVIVGNLVTPTASILLGNGDGTFQSAAPLSPTISSSYTAVAAADLNGDGKIDLVVLTSNYGSGATLAVLFGNGDGTFQSPVTYSVPTGPYIVLADFNGDGRPDIGVTGPIFGGQTNEVSILVNEGDGSFQAPVNYPVSGIIEDMVAADINEDGKLDLIVPTGGTSAAVSVLLGNGNGTFGDGTSYTSSLLNSDSSQVTVADFNGDGKVDLALTNSLTNDIAILLGNGDGTFQNPPKIYNGGLRPAAVLALDANGDNKPDLSVFGGYGSDLSLSVFINRGDGSFPSRVTYPVLSNPYSVVAADFNGDAKPDIATTSFSQSGGISALIGNGDGTFQPHLDSPTEQAGTLPYPTVLVPSVIAAGDFNNDHDADLVVAGTQQTSSGSTSPVLTALLGNGDGTFQDNINLNQVLANGVQSLAAGDFNGDGNLDVAATATNTNDISLFLGNGDGTFAAPLNVPIGPMVPSPPYGVLTGDFNADGKADLAVGTDDGIAVLLGNGNGTFQGGNLTSSLLSYDPADDLLALGDFNGDGKLDFVKGTQTNIINVALGNGDGTFQNAPGFQFPSILNFESTAVGDFNSDGKLDVAFVSQSSNVMTVLLGNGDGTFCCEVHYDAGDISNNVRSMTAADFDGDGAADLAFANFGDATVSVFMNAPVAAFAPRELAFATEEAGSSSVAQTVTLTNPGSAPLDIRNISTNGDFSQTSDCPTKLGAGAACRINITFSPTAAGSRTGALILTDNASVVPQAIGLSGNGVAAPDFVIAPSADSSTSATVTAGGTATYSLSIAPVAGFNQAISFTCSGAPSSATCSVSPAALTLNGTAAANLTVSVTTMASGSGFLLPANPNPLSAVTIGVALLGLLACAGVVASGVGRTRQLSRIAPIAMLVVVLVVFCASCGGNGGSSTPPPPGAAGTPSGTYTVVITGTSGELSHSQSLTVTVE